MTIRKGSARAISAGKRSLADAHSAAGDPGTNQAIRWSPWVRDLLCGRAVVHDFGPGSFRSDLLAEGLLIETPIAGLYQLSGEFERIVQAIAELVHRAGSDQDATLVFLPPLAPREALERTDYLRSFPHQFGSIDIFVGGDREHAELVRLADSRHDWTRVLSPAEVVLAPAACLSLYAGLAGTLPPAGRLFEVQAYCFRHEPSTDPSRMQSFRMREFVFVGTPKDAIAHRDRWLERGADMLCRLGLSVEPVVANDPFFGRTGRVLSSSQRTAELKYEIVTSAIGADEPAALASANYHRDHFSRPFGILTADGQAAHSACFGFGLERIALALLRTHGLDTQRWPSGVTGQLWP